MTVHAKLWVVGLLWSVGMLAHAYTFTVYEVNSVDDEIYVSVDEARIQWWAGVLGGTPHMYTFSLSQAQPFRVMIHTPCSGETLPASILLVRDNEWRGVELIERYHADELSWVRGMDRLSVICTNSALLTFPLLQTGIYRLEVSTPDNTGQYWLQFGERAEGSWWQKYRTARLLQHSAGVWGGMMIWSPLVYEPALVMLLFGSAGYWWWRRRRGRKI